MKKLNNLLQILSDSKIDFVLIGGYAATVHGSSMVTQDLDICAVITKENIEKLRDILKAYNPVHRMTPQKISFFTHPQDPTGWSNLYLETDIGVIDVISQVTGVGAFEQVAKNSIELKVFGKSCKVISVEDLILAKKTLGREKDLIAVKELEAIRSRKKQ